MTLDPIGPLLMVSRPGNVESLNWYNYCNNNPVMYHDPDGLWTFSSGYSGIGGCLGGGQVSLGVTISYSKECGFQIGGYDSGGAGGFFSAGGSVGAEWAWFLNKNISDTGGVSTEFGGGRSFALIPIGFGSAVNIPGMVDPVGNQPKQNTGDAKPIISVNASLALEPCYEAHIFVNGTVAKALIQIGGEEKEAPIHINKETLTKAKEFFVKQGQNLKLKTKGVINDIKSKWENRPKIDFNKEGK